MWVVVSHDGSMEKRYIHRHEKHINQLLCSCRQIYRSSHGSYGYGWMVPKIRLNSRDVFEKAAKKKGICLLKYEFAAGVLPTVGVKW